MEKKQIEVAENEFRWEIEKFSELRVKYPFKEKRSISSKNFCIPPHFEWKLRFFPNGNVKEGYIGIFLVPVGPPYKREISFSLTCQNQLNPVAGDKTRTTKHNFASGEDWGFSMFMTKDELAKGFTFGDSITIIIKINEINPQSLVKLNITTIKEIQKHCTAHISDLIDFSNSQFLSISDSCISHQLEIKDGETVDYLLKEIQKMNTQLNNHDNHNHDHHDSDNRNNHADRNNNNGELNNDRNNNDDDDKNIIKNNKTKTISTLRKWSLRKNQTLRPSKIASTDSKLSSFMKVSDRPIYFFYEEVEVDCDMNDKNSHLIFLKFFDILNSTITVSNERIYADERILDFIHRSAKLKEFDENNILLFEEITSSFLEPIQSLHSTFSQLEIADGDIIIFQSKPTKENEILVSDYYFKQLPKYDLELYEVESPCELTFKFTINVMESFGSIIRKVAQKFDVIEENLIFYRQKYNGEVDHTAIDIENRYFPLCKIIVDTTRPVLYFQIMKCNEITAQFSQQIEGELNDHFNTQLCQIEDENSQKEMFVDYLKSILFRSKKELYNKRKKLNILSEQHTILQKQLDAQILESSSREEKRICKKCNKNQWSILLLPCSHQCLCDECASVEKVCPVCNLEITSTLVPFHS